MTVIDGRNTATQEKAPWMGNILKLLESLALQMKPEIIIRYKLKKKAKLFKAENFIDFKLRNIFSSIDMFGSFFMKLMMNNVISGAVPKPMKKKISLNIA